jgi:hypothetical protein
MKVDEKVERMVEIMVELKAKQKVVLLELFVAVRRAEKKVVE